MEVAMSHSPRILIALLAAALFGHAALDAQVVAGRVVNEVTGERIAEVQVRLQSADGRALAAAVTDSAGEFQLQAPRFGEFVLEASMIGLATVTTPPIHVGAGTMEVVLRMSTRAVPLDPITVEATGGAADLGLLTGYYERMRWNERVGVGRFLTRDAIEARNPVDMSDMLREIPRVSVGRARGTGAFITMRGARGECTPALYVDGARANRRDRAYVDEMVRPGDVEGVEVYVGLAQLPGEYMDENHCGVLLVWTRRSSEDGRPFSWRRIAAAAGIVGGIMLLVR
jgi:hypothetical protein